MTIGISQAMDKLFEDIFVVIRDEFARARAAMEKEAAESELADHDEDPLWRQHLRPRHVAFKRHRGGKDLRCPPAASMTASTTAEDFVAVWKEDFTATSSTASSAAVQDEQFGDDAVPDSLGDDTVLDAYLNQGVAAMLVSTQADSDIVRAVGGHQITEIHHDVPPTATTEILVAVPEAQLHLVGLDEATLVSVCKDSTATITEEAVIVVPDAQPHLGAVPDAHLTGDVLNDVHKEDLVTKPFSIDPDVAFNCIKAPSGVGIRGGGRAVALTSEEYVVAVLSVQLHPVRLNQSRLDPCLDGMAFETEHTLGLAHRVFDSLPVREAELDADKLLGEEVELGVMEECVLASCIREGCLFIVPRYNSPVMSIRCSIECPGSTLDGNSSISVAAETRLLATTTRRNTKCVLLFDVSDFTWVSTSGITSINSLLDEGICVDCISWSPPICLESLHAADSYKHWESCDRKMLQSWDPGIYFFQCCILVGVPIRATVLHFLGKYHVEQVNLQWLLDQGEQ